MQTTPVKFSPITGSPILEANLLPNYFREPTASIWWHNPWTGARRHQADVKSDPYGYLIRPEGEPLKAALKLEVYKDGERMVDQAAGVAEFKEACRRGAAARDTVQAALANDQQVGGGHYKDKAIQPWDFIVANNIGYLEGNAIKYLSRWRDKGGIEDLKKARHYIDKLIETEVAR